MNVPDPKGSFMVPAPDSRAALTKFPTTDWGLVVSAASADVRRSREPLAALCEIYWYPIYAYIRRKGYPADQAQDLTQEFFARVLERHVFADADPGRGRFRSFLRTVCAHYLANRREEQQARKRGGGKALLSIDGSDAESRYAREPAHELTAERIFDRTWALTVLARVLDQLRWEYAESGRAAILEALGDILTADPQAASHAQIAERLGMTEGAVRVALHRLRRRYGVLLRQVIGATVDDPGAVDEEIRALFVALAE